VPSEPKKPALGTPDLRASGSPQVAKPSTGDKIKAAAPTPKMDALPLEGVRAVIANRMHESHQVTAPVTLTTEVCATAFVQLRQQLVSELSAELGFSIGYNELIIKVIANALRAHRYMNARLEDGVIHFLEPIHVGLAVDAPRGLVVPVIRDVDTKGVAEIGSDLRRLIERVNAGTASPEDLSGGTFTVTNLGMFEIDAFTPIINLPQTAILGVGQIKSAPAVLENQLCIQQMLWLSLTFDHRLVDGAPAARFLQYIKRLIEKPGLLLK
jgi:pyruvate dehydrogenase E2 component (dihydrolipoamide acetyltransferase)